MLAGKENASMRPGQPGSLLRIIPRLLKNGLALTGVKGDATIVVIGVVLILSILLTNLLQRRSAGE